MSERTKADLEAAFPAGSYTVTGTGGTSGPATLTASSSQALYPQSVPYLTGSTFANLQGFDPLQAFTFTFNPLLTDPLANTSLIGFFIQNASTFATVADPTIASTATSYTLAANTLQANTRYTFDLVFQSDLYNFPSGSQTIIDYSYDTSGSFVTGSPSAIPEPSSLALCCIAGIIGVTITSRVGWVRTESTSTGS